MKFLKAAGIRIPWKHRKKLDDIEIDENSQAVLVAYAYVYMSSGLAKPISAKEWGKLSIHSKTAILSARKRIRMEDACIVGKAMGGGMSFASLYAELDDGESMDGAFLGVFMGKAIDRLKKGAIQ